MAETPDAELMTCSGYLRRMEPMARWAARRHEAPHPYLARDDLLSDAMEALCRVWRQHYEKSPGDLCRIGRVAVLRRMWDARAHAWSRGEGEVAAWVDLDQALGEEGHPEGGLRMSDILGADGIEDTFFWFALDELERNLDEVGRLVLGELLDPGQKTLRAIRRVWRKRAGKRGNWWAKYRDEVVAKGLGLSRVKVKAALARLRKEATETFLSGEIPITRYRDIWGGAVSGQQLIEEKGDAMGNEKGFLPDDLEIALPEPEKPVVKQATAKVKSAAARPGGSAKKKAKPKAGKKAAKAKALKAGKPRTGKKAVAKLKKVGKSDGVMGFIAGEFQRKAATVALVVAAALEKFPGKSEKTVTATTRFILGDGHGYLAKKGLAAERDAEKGVYRIVQK